MARDAATEGELSEQFAWSLQPERCQTLGWSTRKALIWINAAETGELWPAADPPASHPQSVVRLGSERELLELVANSVISLWDIVNDLTRLRPSQCERYRVTSSSVRRAPRGSLGLCSGSVMSPRS